MPLECSDTRHTRFNGECRVEEQNKRHKVRMCSERPVGPSPISTYHHRDRTLTGDRRPLRLVPQLGTDKIRPITFDVVGASTHHPTSSTIVVMSLIGGDGLLCRSSRVRPVSDRHSPT